ncbi:hypothetical protein MASR1M36_17920 [Candidatus Cloacimonadaceae bacterium]
MKKFILPLLLLLAVGMLVAVESAPSAVVGYVKYPCLTGLNLIALPMSQGYTMASDLANSYPGSFDSMNYWDNAVQGWVTAFDLGYWEGDFAVAEGSVVYLNALANVDVYSIGQLPAQNASYGFVAGLNTMMVPLNYSAMTMASDVATAVGTFDSMNYWDNTVQGWVTAFDLGYWEGDFPVSIGFPMYVNSLSATTWPVRASASPIFGTRSK